MAPTTRNHGYRPAGRTERVGSSSIRIIRRPGPAIEDRQNGKVTFIPGGSVRPGQFPELERLKERFRKEREAAFVR